MRKLLLAAIAATLLCSSPVFAQPGPPGPPMSASVSLKLRSWSHTYRGFPTDDPQHDVDVNVQWYAVSLPEYGSTPVHFAMVPPYPYSSLRRYIHFVGSTSYGIEIDNGDSVTLDYSDTGDIGQLYSSFHYGDDLPSSHLWFIDQEAQVADQTGKLIIYEQLDHLDAYHGDDVDFYDYDITSSQTMYGYGVLAQFNRVKTMWEGFGKDYNADLRAEIRYWHAYDDTWTDAEDWPITSDTDVWPTLENQRYSEERYKDYVNVFVPASHHPPVYCDAISVRLVIRDTDGTVHAGSDWINLTQSI